MEINDLLSSMASEGSVDSSGTFTLDMDHAQAKLDDYRLPDPALFILNLVAAAVLTGAHEFIVETERAETRIFFNGKWPEPQRLPELFTYILKPSQYPAQRELALALHAAQSLPNDPRIWLLVGTREGAWQAQLQGTRLDPRPVPMDRIGVKITVQHTASSPWARLLGHSQIASGQRILEQLFHFCRYAPLDLKVNGQPKGSTVPMGLHADEGPFARLFAQGAQKLTISRPASRRSDLFIAPDRPSPVASSILVGLASPIVAEREGLLLISRGVTFRRSNQVLGNPLACAVVTADHLEKNLSQTDLVENQDYHQLLEQVRLQVEQLLQEVCARPPLFKAAHSEALRALLELRFPQQPRPLQVETFFRVQTLATSCLTPAGAVEQTEYYLSLDPEQRKQASSLRDQLQSALKFRVVQATEDRRWAEANQFSEQLERLGFPVRVDFRMVLAYFSGNLELARRLDSNSNQDCTPTRLLLRYIWGWSSDPPTQSPLSRFFELERALRSRDEGRAAELANQLAGASQTPFLQLWLGWYCWLRRDYRGAEQRWFQLLSRVSPALYKLWYPRMWKMLAGKLPLTSQVRWQARQGIRSYLARPKEFERTELNEDPGLFGWSRRVWELRAQGKAEEASQLALQTMLGYLLVPQKLGLEAFSSPDLAVALPTS
ncbi:MAG: hypothetical protein U0931_13540 [Vulcanimicrobiota bacterium]